MNDISRGQGHVTTRSSSLGEFRVSRDTDLLSGRDLARVEYRHEGQVRWSKFVVVLDEETSFETVDRNVEAVVAAYEESQSRVR